MVQEWVQPVIGSSEESRRELSSRKDWGGMEHRGGHGSGPEEQGGALPLSRRVPLPSVGPLTRVGGPTSASSVVDGSDS